MAIYVYTDQPNNRYQPTEYTIAYYPLNSTTELTDQSWHGYDASMEWTPTYDNLWITLASPLTWFITWMTEMSWVTQQGTLNIWTKITSFWAHQFVNMWNSSVDHGSILICSITNWRIQLGDQWSVSGWYFSSQLNTRYNLIATYTPWSMKLYVNGNTTPAITWNVTLSGSANWKSSIWWFGSWSFILSEAILESKEWTPQEVSNYFNQTKGDYWIQ